MNDDPNATHDETAGARAGLLRLARVTIERYLTTGEGTPCQTDDPWLQAPAAVFVTLRRRGPAGEVVHDPGSLRGCIGHIEADRPLYVAVQDAAIKAATIDPRFDPVAPDELPRLSIEISILSPMRPLAGPDEVRLGRDGLLIVGKRHRGLLLPEVPLGFGWDEETFVTAVCRKAGLPDDAWRGDARLYAFTTEVIEET